MKKNINFKVVLLMIMTFVCFGMSSCGEDSLFSDKPAPEESYFVGNVFQIIVQDLGEQPIATGSAFVFNEDGWYITNAHVMKDAYYAKAIFNIPDDNAGESYTYLDINSGSYYHGDKDIYIGKIENYNKIKKYYNDIPINTNYSVGETTYSIGYPNSSTELEINKGKVTEVWTDLYEKLYSGNKYICSSSYIAPGSSGGILVNDDLEVIGITTLGWTNDYDQFISGASISAFNFKNLLDNNDHSKLKTLIDRFHSNEKVYIGLFNDAKEEAEKGGCKKGFTDEGLVTYTYEWKDEGVNSDNYSYTEDSYLYFTSDGFMIYREEYYWSDGSRRIIGFLGQYNHETGLDDFYYLFEYKWSDGSYYNVNCLDINYSPTIALTLNKATIDSSYGFTPSQENIDYAKEMFNIIYEWLTEELAQFK